MRPPFYILIAASAVVLIIVLRVWSKWRKKRKKFEEVSQITRRNEALNEALRDPSAKEIAFDGSKEPLEISWDDKVVNQGAAVGTSMMVELVELSAYSRRKYVFRADHAISIGSGNHNRLILTRDGVAEWHCEIRLAGKQLCVRSLSDAKTILKRKKMDVLVGPDGIYLNNGDRIQLGASEIQVRMFKA